MNNLIYLPPGMALLIDLGGLTKAFLVDLVCTFSTLEVHLCFYLILLVS